MSTSQLLIGELVRRNAAVAPDRAAIWMGGVTVDFRSLDQQANRIAWALHEIGIRRGDRIVSWADTCLEVIPLFVASARLGAVFAPLNAHLSVGEAQPIVEMARARMMIADASHAEAAAELKARTETGMLGLLGAARADACDLVIDPSALPARNEEYVEPELQERDPQVIFFTSGSTGRPKGVVLSHRANYLRTYQGVFLAEPERSVCMFPLFHMAAFTLAMSAWQTQGEIAFVASADPAQILDAVEQRRANRLYCIPAVWNRILSTDPGEFDTASLRYIDTGTSATPLVLLKALKARFPQALLRVYYGSTEAGAGTTLYDADVLRKPGSVGQASPGVDLTLSEAGEICLRTQYLMDGYFDNPEATAEVLRDGWYHTGDLGSIDEEGYVSVVGRAKDIIRSGGESVAPVEIEAVLCDHPQIEEIAILGIPDVTWGEVICAVVVPRPGCEISLASLQGFCDGRLARFKHPRRLELRDGLPRTAATGQVQRLLLVEEILAGSVS